MNNPQLDDARTIILSSSGISNIAIRDENDKFTFHFGKKEVKMHHFLAEFLSPKVSNLLKADHTINSIDFNGYSTISFDELITDNTISQLQQISSGIPIKITKSDAFKLKNISIILGNEELFNIINEKFPIDFDKTTIDELINEIQLYINPIYNFKEINCSNIIDYLSSHFSIIDTHKMKVLPKSILFSIITNKHFTIDNEDALIDFIDEIFTENQDSSEFTKSQFYEQVNFSKLSKIKLREFTENYDYSQMTNQIMNKLKPFFIFNQPIECKYDESDKNFFKGIIHYLTREFGGNVHDLKIVRVITPNIYHNDPKVVVNLDNNEFFHTNYDEVQWVAYDFGQWKLWPTHYSIKTRTDQSDYANPVDWCIEVSNSILENVSNIKDWKIIDSRTGVTSLQKHHQSDIFEIETHLPQNESYRYIRLRMTGKSTGGCNALTLNSLEYFGVLYHK